MLPNSPNDDAGMLSGLCTAIASHADLFVLVFDEDGKVTRAVGTACGAFGAMDGTADDLFECPELDAFAGDPEFPCIASARAVMRGKDGRRANVRITATRVDGSRGFLVLVQDLSEWTAIEKEAAEAFDRVMTLQAELDQQSRELGDVIVALEGMALFDGLTGVANHRHFSEQLRAMLDVCVRVHQPMSLVAIDVDHFKLYNDTFGHAAGDQALAGIGEILRGSLRVRDLAARPGGEEFALLLPITDLETAREIAESVRVKIEERDWFGRGVTASFGVACSSETLKRPDELQAAADEALYQAKAAGRNQVCVGGKAHS